MAVGLTMSSNGSFQYEFDVDLEDLPVLESVDSSGRQIERLRCADEVERFRLASTLTMIELSLCFRNRPEPLFDLLSPLFWSIIRL